MIMLPFEMMCYNVYVTLLLRLSNDVEENPGPTIYEIVNSNNTVRADFSQGNQAKFGENAGKQCVAMSLTAIIFKYVTDIYYWDSADLTSILAHGNCLYNCIKVSVKKYFFVVDMHDMVSLEEKIYSLTYSESLTGELFMINDNGPYVSLKNAFDELFYGIEINYEYCLLTIDCSTVAVFKNISGNCYKVFDSHARGLHGMPHCSGTAVLLTVEGLDYLVTFFQKTTYHGRSMPFEIKGVSINVACTNQKQCIPTQNNTDLSADNQNSQSKISSKRKLADAEQVLNMKTKRDENENDRKKIANEDAKKREKRLKARDINYLKKKTNEDESSREKRLAKRRQVRGNESLQCRKNRLTAKQVYDKKLKTNETAKHKEKRLLTKQVYNKQLKMNETAEHKEKRILQKQVYNKKAKENETAKHKEKRLLQKQVYNINERDYTKRAKKCSNTNEAGVISDLVHKFHIAVSKGPLYICTCCDQLWYSHSVNSAEKLRLSNPDMVLYLLNKLSVDNIEWIC